MGQIISGFIAFLNPPVREVESSRSNTEERLHDGEEKANTANPGSYFGTHFLMGGERYDVAKPDTFLFGDNSDLELLGSKPVPFPYNLRGVSDTVSALNAFVNIRRDSLKFVKVLDENSEDEVPSIAYRIEFIFDCDAPCYVQIHFCAKEVVDRDAVWFVSKYSMESSAKFRYEIGAEQLFNQFVFYPNHYDLKLMQYESGHYFPVVIELRTTDNPANTMQVQTTLCSIERSADPSAVLILKPLKQKIIANGGTYLLQEIFGIENKERESHEENGAECIICMANPRDTVILPCRHLCICNGCAETLRYKLNNCPICRSPFKALLKLKTIQVAANVPHGTSPRSRNRCETLTLVEALNGPSTPSTASSAASSSPSVHRIRRSSHLKKLSIERIKAPEMLAGQRDEGSQQESEDIELQSVGSFANRRATETSSGLCPTDESGSSGKGFSSEDKARTDSLESTNYEVENTRRKNTSSEIKNFLKMLFGLIFLLLGSLCIGKEPEAPQDKEETKNNPLAHGLGDDIDWVEWDQAVSISLDLNKPIFLLIHKTWCGACQSLKGRLSKDPKRNEFVELSKKFVMVNLEDDEEPQDEKYAPDGGYIPRLFFLDKKGDPMAIDNKEKYAKNPHFYPELTQILGAMKKALKEFGSVETPKEEETKKEEVVKEERKEPSKTKDVEEEPIDKEQDKENIKEKDLKKEEQTKKEEKKDAQKAQDQKGDKGKKKESKKDDGEAESKERKSDELKKKEAKNTKKEKTEEPKATCPHAAGAKKEAEKKKKQKEEKEAKKEEKVKKDKKEEKQKKKKEKDEPKDEL
uniref:RING-type E3 ubiquitin transferase n=1 Tax=Acrobeloides nanus TaxID=290746 RepID=A0A914E580_9BILA